MKSLEEKWKSFGWNVLSVDGHSEEDLLIALSVKSNIPVVIIANTIKGKGVSFMENNALWHNNRLTEEQFARAIEEQEVNYD